jgi:hypothetical protein
MSLPIRVSSAKIIIRRIRKMRGPITDPCGTPEITGAGSDRSPLTITVWCLPVRNECSHLSIFPSIPNSFSLARVTLSPVCQMPLQSQGI